MKTTIKTAELRYILKTLTKASIGKREAIYDLYEFVHGIKDEYNQYKEEHNDTIQIRFNKDKISFVLQNWLQAIEITKAVQVENIDLELTDVEAVNVKIDILQNYLDSLDKKDKEIAIEVVGRGEKPYKLVEAVLSSTNDKTLILSPAYSLVVFVPHYAGGIYDAANSHCEIVARSNFDNETSNNQIKNIIFNANVFNKTIKESWYHNTELRWSKNLIQVQAFDGHRGYNTQIQNISGLKRSSHNIEIPPKRISKINDLLEDNTENVSIILRNYVSGDFGEVDNKILEVAYEKKNFSISYYCHCVSKVQLYDRIMGHKKDTKDQNNCLVLDKHDIEKLRSGIESLKPSKERVENAIKQIENANADDYSDHTSI